MPAIEWIYKCGSEWKWCPDGLCERYNQLKEEHKRPASEMSVEWKDKTGKTWRDNAISQKFRKLTMTKDHSYEKPSYETCTISDLDSLVESGKKFGTIYADPPWQYSNQATRSSTDKHYPTMSVNDIAALPVPKFTEEKAHLHLWTTNAFLFESREILEAWGFEYKSVFVWVKPQMGIGNYWRVSHEFMLLGVKGGLTFNNHSEMSWKQLDRTKHSKKPDEVAKIIERVSPGPRIELFGRLALPGWTVWGNQIKKEDFYIETRLQA